jgi:hypothetical protein
MTPARAWQWLAATRARRSALTLAVLAAMASPFVAGSYKAPPYSWHDVPLTATDRAEIIARWGEDTDVEGCEQAAKQEQLHSIYSVRALEFNCARDRNALKYGFRPEQYQSLSRYVALNGAVMLAALMVTFFALTAAMAAVRKWWRWWWGPLQS